MSSQYSYETNNDELLEKVKKLLLKDDKNAKIEEKDLKETYPPDNVLSDGVKMLRVTSGNGKLNFSVKCVNTNVINIKDEKGEPKAVNLKPDEIREKAKNPSFSRKECSVLEELVAKDRYLTEEDLKKVFKNTMKDKEIDLEVEGTLLGREEPKRSLKDRLRGKKSINDDDD